MTIDWLLVVYIALCGIAFIWASIMKWRVDQAAKLFEDESDAYGPQEAWRRYRNGEQGKGPTK